MQVLCKHALLLRCLGIQHHTMLWNVFAGPRNSAIVCAGQGRQAYGSTARVHPLFGQDGAAEGQRSATACQMVHSSPVLAI